MKIITSFSTVVEFCEAASAPHACGISQTSGINSELVMFRRASFTVHTCMVRHSSQKLMFLSLLHNRRWMDKDHNKIA